VKRPQLQLQLQLQLLGTMKRLWFILITLLPREVCSSAFLLGEEVGEIWANEIEEASGLAASWRNEGILWTHQDLGNGPIIYAITTDGHYLGGYQLLNVSNHDMEDIAVGPGPEPGVSYIYLGDTGNNNLKKESRDTIQVYRIKEPLPPRQGYIENLHEIDTLTMAYPTDEEYIDSEALLVDPILGEIYVLQKQGARITTIYATPPQTIFAPGSASPPLEFRGIIEGIAWVTGGDVSRNGREILLKRSDRIFYFQRSLNESVSEALLALDGFEVLPYEAEVQGEGIAFAADLSGYYTLSETKDQVSVPLLFYPRDPAFSLAPSRAPTLPPTLPPTKTPTKPPTLAPTHRPTTPKPTSPSPTSSPTDRPTIRRTKRPTSSPTDRPTVLNITLVPTEEVSTFDGLSVTIHLPSATKTTTTSEQSDTMNDTDSMVDDDAILDWNETVSLRNDTQSEWPRNTPSKFPSIIEFGKGKPCELRVYYYYDAWHCDPMLAHTFYRPNHPNSCDFCGGGGVRYPGLASTAFFHLAERGVATGILPTTMQERKSAPANAKQPH
jgi:hypothetical protein